MKESSSTPSLTEFDPTVIPFQYQVIKDIRTTFDYSLGSHEILLSGSIGSSKSTVMAHIAVTHCIFNSGARFLIGRLSMPALRATLFAKIIEHIAPDLKEGRDYFINQVSATIKFRNGSEIVSRSWADRKFFKVRSLDLSGAAIEETIETNEQDFYNEIKMRIGRLPHVKENIIINATNPGSPSSWIYKYFIAPNSGGEKHPTKHVYYSRTEDNPFLPDKYINQLKNDLDPKLARRMLYGEWIEIADEVIYYQYDTTAQYSKKPWEPRPETTIMICWDFNIGDGKPLSACAMAYEDGSYHVFAEVIIDGARTDEACREFFDRGIVVPGRRYEIHGDASGKARHTSSKRSDYEVIKEAFDREKINYTYKVPLANPAIRTRHNTINALCRNDLGDVRLFIHNCPTVDEGLRLTAFKKGASMVEDDSKRFQHVTTALGYALVRHQSSQKTGDSYSTVL
jgi:hypothetical protein